MKHVLLVILIVFHAKSFAQAPSRVRRIIDFNYTPIDFFLNYAATCRNINHTFIIGFGVNRTVFQQRFYPALGYQYSRQLQITNGTHVVPYTKLTVNRLKVTTAGAHYWINPELGCNFEFGNMRRIGVGAGYRSLFEFWRENKQGNRSMDFGLTLNLFYVF